MSNSGLFKAIRLITGGLDQTQVNSINGILTNCLNQGVTDPVLQGYILSTGWHEARLRPVREGFKKTDAEARKYVRRNYPTKYGKPAGPYGHYYYGRGLVQLTWLKNYERSSRDVGVDLVKYPDKVLSPDIAARLIVIGMMDGRWNGSGKGLVSYLGNGRRDYRNARRTVNITDKWQTFRDTAIQFTAALESHGYTPEQPRKVPTEVKTGGGLIATGGAVIAADPSLWAHVVAVVVIGLAGLGIFMLIKSRRDKEHA